MRQLIILIAAMLVLPMLGMLLAGFEAAPYLEFPPRSLYVSHAPFSPWVFAAYLAFIAGTLWPFLRAGLLSEAANSAARPKARFPRWGWVGVLLTAGAWTAAWTRLPFLAPLQPHTFFPLWLGYIITVNALCFRASGGCRLTHQPREYLLLFPASAVFWWSFEYLNRFVQNWSYLNVEHFSSLEYLVFASLSFSTVLPAVAVTKDLLDSAAPFDGRFDYLLRWGPPSRTFSAAALTASALMLLLLGVLPNLLFAALWAAPLIWLTALQALDRRPSIFSETTEGRWSAMAAWAAAALVCGFFWELWNCFSLCKWVYHLPYVEVLKVFEMPLLGYAGYLPFGVFCGAIIDLLTGPSVIATRVCHKQFCPADRCQRG